MCRTMKGALRILALGAFVALVFAGRTARADRDWDSSGWSMLGEQEARGHREREDVIEVGRDQGKFTRMSIVVRGGDVELYDVTVEFYHGDNWHPDVPRYFREGLRSRVLDLPTSDRGRDDRSIKRIKLSYKNVSDDSYANPKIQFWARQADDGYDDRGGHDRYTAPSWDSRGWTNLGERELEGHGRRERSSVIDVGRQEGRFSKLTLVMLDADAEITDFTVNFSRGDSWKPNVNHYFKEGQRTRVLEVPSSAYGSDGRSIKSIEFHYRNTPDGGHARVQIWALREAERREWNSDGWTMLGEREVRGHGREVKDRLEVGRSEGKFSRMTIVVLDSDLEIIAMSVTFGRGDPWKPEIKHNFKEGQRARVVEFPPSEHGNDERSIRWVDFTYRNLPGEGHARVQVWAR